MVRPGSQNARVLHALRSGRWVAVPTIHARAGSMRLNSRISELRGQGYDIEHGMVKGRSGAASHRYRLRGGPPIPEEEEGFLLDDDDLTPRTPEHRFRLYSCSTDNALGLVATTDSEEGVGVTICTLGREGEFDMCSVGILDAAGEDGTYDKGQWIVNPWNARVK